MTTPVTGGAVSEATIEGVLYYIHTFLNDGDFVIPSGFDLNLDYMLVGGGGSGGRFAGFTGVGGGGAGGLLTGSIMKNEGSYPVTIGLGGPGKSDDGPGWSGSSTSVFGLTALGGGGGGYGLTDDGLSGGSGGGGGRDDNQGAGTVGQGNPGGAGFTETSTIRAGGGGGAGEPGSDAVYISSRNGFSGKGGDGVVLDISGTPVRYSGGGGGCGGQNSSDLGGDVNGAAGLGGGSAGSYGSGNGNSADGVDGLGGGSGGHLGNNASGKGGDGVVVLRYRASEIGIEEVRKLKSGTVTPDDVYFGASAVSKIYLGTNLVWE